MSLIIPFNRPYMTGRELFYIAQANFQGQLSGDGPFTKQCHQWLKNNLATTKALLTHSCTAALEMQSLLVGIHPGDEVIMPSYTFVSTANSVALRGGVPVFIDIRKDTLNINEALIEAAITQKTKAIAPVHYAGVACEMDTIMDIAQKHHLRVIEDAAQGLMSTYKGKPLGSIGDLGALSFHETKNIISGEGGALLINDQELALQAEIIREKGTDRSRYFRGEVDKYTWQDVGSSYLPGEIIAAFLWAQLQDAESITANRMEAWKRYHVMLDGLEQQELLRRPIVPKYCSHNAHMYYILLNDNQNRQVVLDYLKEHGVHAVFHYVPLHSAPAGRKFGRVTGSISVTENLASKLIRLPLWYGISANEQKHVVDCLFSVLTQKRNINHNSSIFC